MPRTELQFLDARSHVDTFLKSQLDRFGPRRELITIPEAFAGAVDLSAHRCAGKFVPGDDKNEERERMAPENTEIALVTAFRFGFRQVEYDVLYNVLSGEKPTAFVVHSDDPLERTTDGEGSPFTKTAEYLLSLDAGKYLSPVFAGTKIPQYKQMESLGQILEISSLTELKVPRDKDNVYDTHPKASLLSGTLFANEKLEMHRRYNTAPTPILSFSDTALKAIRRVSSHIPLVRNIDWKEDFAQDNWSDWRDYLRRGVGCMTIDPDSRLLIDQESGLINEEFIHQIQADGFRVRTYLSNNPGAIIRDEPALLQRFVNLGVSPVTDIIHRVKPPSPTR